MRVLPNVDDGKDDFDSEERETHATVLDKLLAWEKLYDEVKGLMYLMVYLESANYCSNDRINPGQLSEMPEDICSLGLLLLELLKGKPLADRDGNKNFRSMEEINELVGGQESFDERLDIPKDKCKIMALAKFGEIAKWCSSSSWSFGKNQNYPKIVDVLSGLTQVKQLFPSASC